LFFRKLHDPTTFCGQRATESSAAGAGSDSLIAPQAVEIAQNGLVNAPPRVGSEGGSIRRTPDAHVIKRSLVIAGHRTSVSLEDAFWRRLRAIAAERGLSLNGLAAMIDASRDGANLSSAIRVFVLEAEGARPSRPAEEGAAPPDQ
jgi:predicted DNA-binding ribbon-helix-helix protein